MYAEPSALGFDPTMTSSQAPDGSVRYDISVPSPSGEVHVYRTTGVLYDGGFGALRGRGTRVWKARRLNEVGELVGAPVALKDSWVDWHREREGDISSRIRESSASLEREDFELLNEMLLTILDHGDVLISGRPDCTRSLPPDKKSKVDSLQVHYRIVYAEVGTPLREETSLHVIYQALTDICGCTSIHRFTGAESYSVQVSTHFTRAAGSTGT